MTFTPQENHPQMLEPNQDGIPEADPEGALSDDVRQSLAHRGALLAEMKDLLVTLAESLASLKRDHEALLTLLDGHDAARLARRCDERPPEAPLPAIHEVQAIAPIPAIPPSTPSAESAMPRESSAQPRAASPGGHPATPRHALIEEILLDLD